MSASPWFPRPAQREDLQAVDGPGALDARAAFALLASGGVELRAKVGVAGPMDGSAKSSTRLLAHGSFVFKTNLALAFDGPRERLIEQVLAQSRRERQLGLWHPLKQWFVLRHGAVHLPVSACPELVTVRQERGSKLASFTDILALCIDAFALHGVGLDSNPSNFGREHEAGPLHYVDDETYRAFGLAEIASFLVARLPEEADIDEHGWRRFGRDNQAVLSKLCSTPRTWLELCAALEDHPLAAAFHAKRRALVAGIREDNARMRGGHSRTRALTCVLADVHANAPALEAVLRDAREQGADSYLFLGDAVGYGPHPAACVRRLMELADAICIRGNHDHAIAAGAFESGANRLARATAEWTRAALDREQLDWLSALPVEHGTDDWLAVHGAPRDPQRFLAYVYELTYEDNLEVLREQRRPLCFHGHTHVQCVHQHALGRARKLGAPERIAVDEAHTLLINPGSVGQPRDGAPTAAYALWSRNDDVVWLQRVPYDVEHTLRDLRALGGPGELCERLSSGR